MSYTRIKGLVAFLVIIVIPIVNGYYFSDIVRIPINFILINSVMCLWFFEVLIIYKLNIYKKFTRVTFKNYESVTIFSSGFICIISGLFNIGYHDDILKYYFGMNFVNDYQTLWAWIGVGQLIVSCAVFYVIYRIVESMDNNLF